MSIFFLDKPAEGVISNMDRNLLNSKGQLIMCPSNFYARYQPNDLRVWAHQHGRYGLPTTELVAWLLATIDGRSAIEIGAGVGDLGRLLGIPMTDSYVQVDDPSIRALYEATKQPPTQPPPDVFKETAEQAMRTRKPKVVVASWVTQRWFPGDEHGYVNGPVEEFILHDVDTYIHIGNSDVHGDKRILSRPHETHYFPWLVSRARDQAKNVIYVWNKTKH